MSDSTTVSTTEPTSYPPSIPEDFHILLYGVDNAYLSFDTEVSEAIYERLMEEQYQARKARTDRNAAYCSPWLDAQVYPTGANGFGILINKADTWTIKVQKGNEHRPGVYLEMRSRILHTHPGGVFAATEEAVTWIRETLFVDAPD
ncbi:MAG: hypothetical protein H0X24_14010, partial [Ktedonobacterales bacterium]|nr:hypothetical protein [Ktedonobacterales bacterium]